MAREAKDSSPTTAEVKKPRIYISTPLIRVHGVVLNKHRDNLIFLLFYMCYSSLLEKMIRIYAYLSLVPDT
jgi:hypothetical protein